MSVATLPFDVVYIKQEPSDQDLLQEIDSVELAVDQRPHASRGKKKRYKRSKRIKLKLDPVTLESGPPYVCTYCDKQFFSIQTFKKHIQVHAYVKAYTCDICRKSFAVEKSLKIHMRGHTGELPYACNYCGKKFKESGSLTKHHRSQHTGVKPYRCTVCAKSFSRSTALKNHSRLHTGEKLNVCELCDRSFSESKSLNRHGLTHSKETPYECKYCEKKFKLKTEWNEHTAQHSGDYIYECLECSEGFDRLKLFRRHLFTHENDYLRCERCKAIFNSLDSKQKHVRRNMCSVLSQQKYKCQICEASYISRKSLTDHQVVHRNDYCESPHEDVTPDYMLTLSDFEEDKNKPDEIIPEQPPSSKSKKKSRKKRATNWKPNPDKTYTCKICSKNFNNYHSLTIHTRSHTGEKPYACTYCDKRFITSSKLTRHVRMHSGEKPFPCKVCGKMFARPTNVQLHMKVHTKQLRIMMSTVTNTTTKVADIKMEESINSVT